MSSVSYGMCSLMYAFLTWPVCRVFCEYLTVYFGFISEIVLRVLKRQVLVAVEIGCFCEFAFLFALKYSV